MKDKLKKLCSTAIFQCVAIAIVLDIILEILGRHSFINTMKYIVNEPLVFLYNCSIIFFTLTLALLMRKRVFGYGIISFAWLLCGVTNCIVLGFRITPFSAIDMLMARNTITIIDKYFSSMADCIHRCSVICCTGSGYHIVLKVPDNPGKYLQDSYNGSDRCIFLYGYAVYKDCIKCTGNLG